MRPALAVAAALAAAASLAAPPPARAEGRLQIDVSALLASPVLSLGQEEGDEPGEEEQAIDAQDVLDPGPGGQVDVLFAVTRSLRVGGSGGFWVTPAEEEVAQDVDLWSFPVHGVARFHTPDETALGLYGEGGAGLTHHRVEDGDDASQTSFSYLVGAGFTYRLSGRFHLTGGARFHHVLPEEGEGEVWGEHEEPKTLLLCLGLSWRR